MAAAPPDAAVAQSHSNHDSLTGEDLRMKRCGILRPVHERGVLGLALALADLARTRLRVCVPELGEEAVGLGFFARTRTRGMGFSFWVFSYWGL